MLDTAQLHECCFHSIGAVQFTLQRQMLYFLKKHLNKINLNHKIKGVFRRLRKINPTTALLLIISVLLIFNLFTSDRQKEITRWNFITTWNDLKPQTHIDKKKISYACLHEVSNEKYKIYFDQSAEECKYAGTGKYSMLLKCLDEKLTDAPPEKIFVDKTCNKTVDDTKWFMFLGKKIFKIKTYYY